MTLIMRAQAGEADIPLIADLIRAAPAHSRHLVDYPWRLSSPAIHLESDARLWMAADGTLAGFARWQIWWSTLDFYIRPGPHRASARSTDHSAKGSGSRKGC